MSGPSSRQRDRMHPRVKYPFDRCSTREAANVSGALVMGDCTPRFQFLRPESKLTWFNQLPRRQWGPVPTFTLIEGINLSISCNAHRYWQKRDRSRRVTENGHRSLVTSLTRIPMLSTRAFDHLLIKYSWLWYTEINKPFMEVGARSSMTYWGCCSTAEINGRFPVELSK